MAKLGYRRILALERPFQKPFDPVSPKVPVDVRMLGPADADGFVAFRQGPNQSLFIGRLEQDNQCYAAISDDQIVSITWVALNSATLWRLNGDFRLDLDEIYVYDSYTRPDYRGLRIQAPIFETIHRRFAEAGYRRALSFVVPENTPNLRSRARLGFTVCGIVRRIRFGPWLRFLSSEYAPILTKHE